eukprot:CAMPEP_0114345648 /NCGR_PEP_ID=MMETSP0101-20121206/12416_1 /TAXON_ID=38822 ORGANISM="Pteridomonas danica, Strain PT" /NCGR_SAMPLE_ID=MMETSP0101 /ASSEMBLY_ACC=CAM_ASM_000211 /LENGTH=546 /DNA_ID=CAMNT_0001481779 /DNA_START=23 /DNA_END=1663 /DNA_ORIENTATION=+
MAASAPNPALEKVNHEIEKLSSLPSLVGKVSVPAESESTILFEIFAAPNLILTESALFKVILPSSFPAKPPTVILLSEVPPNDKAIDMIVGQPVKCTVLDELEGWSRTYNLSVIFYTLRNIFVDESKYVWEQCSTPWLPELPTDLPSGKHFGFIAGHAGGQGRRRTMEDAVVIKQGINLVKKYTQSSSIFAIFDGHAGDTCVNHIAEILPQILIDKLNNNEVSFREAIGTTFNQTDEEFLNNDTLANSKSGCTACLVMFDGQDQLYAGNLGDCRAVLCREGGIPQELTFDCRADRPDEIARIITSGGFVNNKRVNGQLAVSRALGDHDYKRPKGLVTCSPEMTNIRLKEKDEFLLIACDGLWDVLTSQEAIDFIKTRLTSLTTTTSSSKMITTDQLSDISNELVKHAIDDKKSTDNVSVLIAMIVSPENDGGFSVMDKQSINSSNNSNNSNSPTTPIKQSIGVGMPSFDEDDFDSPDPTPTKKTPPPIASSSYSGGGGGGDTDSPSPLKLFSDQGVESKQSAPKGTSIDTDEGLIDFLLDDANFKD